jgi:putative sigma-54 modulation protein
MNEKGNDLILSGTNLDLTEALKRIVHEKMQKLFVHETKIIRLRVDLRRESSRTGDLQFLAKGIIEIRGNDLVASVGTDDLYKSIDLLESKLDRMLRRRSRLRVLKRKHTHAVEIPAMIPKVSSASV